MNVRPTILLLFYAIFITLIVLFLNLYFINFIFNKFKIAQEQNYKKIIIPLLYGFMFGAWGVFFFYYWRETQNSKDYLITVPKNNNNLNISIDSDINFDKKKYKESL